LSFKSKLILSYILIILASFGLMAFFLDRHLEQNSLRDIRSSLIMQASLIENQIQAQKPKNEDIDYLDGLVKTLKPKIQCRLTIIDIKGNVLADSEKSRAEISSMENHLGRPEVKAAIDGNIGVDTHYSPTLKVDMLYVAVPIRSGDQTAGVLRLAMPLENIQKTLTAIRKIVLLGLLFALGLAAVLSYLLVSQITKPINRMMRICRRFAEGDFGRRINHNCSDELGELAVTLNKMAQDIEDKIKQTKEQNQKLTAVFNSMIEGVIVTDKATRIVSLNHTVEEMFGVCEKAAKGKLLLEAVRNSRLSEVISDVLENGRSASAEVNLVHPARKTLQINAAPIFSGNIVDGCLAVVHDITEIKRLETMRSDFVANVSHELKTPLTSIKGFAETLLEGALEDKEHNRSFLKIIHEHAERLNSLVNDLLSLSYFESTEMVLEKKNLDIRGLLDEVVLGFASQRKKKNIAINNELPSGLVVKADRDRLGQVFTNLLDNAVKFGDENSSIKIYWQDTDGKIKVVVEDTGTGIPEKDIPRIFERFYRVDKARSRELGGTGLGLSIVKHIIEQHGGTVGVESIEGAGTKFWFTLPK